MGIGLELSDDEECDEVEDNHENTTKIGEDELVYLRQEVSFIVKLADSANFVPS